MARKLKSLASLLALTVFSFGIIQISPAYAAGDEKAKKIGDAECADCHEDIAESFAKSAHKVYAEDEGFLCESCHGPGSLHAEEEDEMLIFNPKRDFNSTEKSVCLDCHGGSQFESAFGTAHHEAANGCSDCHTVHSTSENLLSQPADQLCQQCHTDIVAQFMLPSHHPVEEGLMTCQDCHEVHGGDNKFAMSEESRELCLTCHASKEGPFVFEHDPVNEDCGICHSPHGTTANNLLAQSEPALCMSCHPMHFHTTLTGLEGTFQAPLFPDRGGVTTLDAFKKGMLTKCTQCHNAIHGSDMPSQGIGSSALTR
ncbi:MAG: DmsE family decaheme c-type cytochrome [Calditrichaeota bacterium]|nr:MAG: DmsE family decaheme c-type cytochrome [Calditrichota bacterium]